MFVCMCCGIVIWILWLMSLQAPSRAFWQHVAVHVCVSLCVLCKQPPCRPYALHRECAASAFEIIFLSVSVCLSPPYLIPPFHPCLSFCLTPSIHLFPSILLLCTTLFCRSRFICHLSPLFIPLSIQGPLAWHSISDTSCMSCSDDASALTDQPQCVSSG